MKHKLLFVALFVLLATLLGVVLYEPVHAAPHSVVIPVTRTDDPPLAVCSIFNCSLREAIIYANNNPGSYIIRLQHNTTYYVVLSVSGSNDDATVGDLNITKDVTFDFADMACTSNCMATIQGGVGANDRVFSIENGAQVQMTWLAIQGGYIMPSNPTGNYDGGGIFIYSGSVLTLTNSTVSNNHAHNGGGIYTLGSLALFSTTISSNFADIGQGGGIYSSSGGGYQPAPLTIDHSIITTNWAKTDGGGVFTWWKANLSNTTISSNTASTGNGAGLYLNNNPATLTNTQIVSNTAQANNSIGGGIFKMTNSLNLTDSTVGWNSASFGGGIGTYTNAFVQATNSWIINNTATAGYGGGILANDTISATNTTISGNKATLDGGGIDAALVTLDHVTISNNTADSDHNGTGVGGGIHKRSIGAFTISNSSITGNSASGSGGIGSDTGNLTVSNTTISGNTATSGDGGGLVSGGTATLNNVIISSNKAELGNGGGFYAGGDATLSNTTISSNTASGNSSNTASGNGGGLYSSSGQTNVTLTNSTIVSNTAKSGAPSIGGGIFFWNGQMNVTNSTVGWNSADSGGGIGTYARAYVQVTNSAIINNTAIYGGGFFDTDFVVTAFYTLTNTTVSGNHASGNGGGMYVYNAALYNATISNNMADSDHNFTGDGDGIYLFDTGQAIMANSILAGNADTGGQPPVCIGGTLASLGYNLIQGENNCTIINVTTGNLIGTNPQLGPLANNGGGTLTHALLAGSPAINAGNPSGCMDSFGALMTTDQRGMPRSVGGRCDMGAYEFGSGGANTIYLPLILR